MQNLNELHISFVLMKCVLLSPIFYQEVVARGAHVKLNSHVKRVQTRNLSNVVLKQGTGENINTNRCYELSF